MLDKIGTQDKRVRKNVARGEPVEPPAVGGNSIFGN
jgi:hypothetical protein